jgi:hypothetical protein
MDNSNQVRAIVPGRQDKVNTATLRPIVVERYNQEGPLTLAHTAIKLAEKTYKGFHAVYSALYVMIAMPEAEPDPLFEALWQLLMLPDSEKEIAVNLHLDENENIKSVDLSNLPFGWTYDYVSIDPEDEPKSEEDIFNANPLAYGLNLPDNNTNHL